MSGWRNEPFEAVIADESGGNLKTPQSEFLDAGRYAVVDQGKELIAGYVNDEACLCRAQLPVIVFGDHTRCFKYVDFPFCMGADGVKVLRPKIDANVKYLYHYLRQLRLTEGGYDRHFKYLKRSSVVVPPLPEQRRIAEVLDRAEALRAKRRAALTQLDSLTQSIFLDMFGDPTTNPKGWPVRSLSSICRGVSDIDHNMPKSVGSGIPFISAKDLIDHGEISFSDVKMISVEDFRRLSRKGKPERNDIIYSRIGVNLGKARLVNVDFEFLASYSCCTIKPNHDLVDKIFLCCVLDSPSTLKQAHKGIRAIAVPDLGMEEIRNFRVVMPPLPRQRDFAHRVAAVEKLKTAHRASLVELDALFASLQHRAFRGEL